VTEIFVTGSLGPFRIALRAPDGTTTCAGVAADGDRPDLTAVVATAFRDAGLPPSSLRRVSVDIGPGSYTGLRIATTFANTCRSLAGVSVATLTSLELAVAAAFPATSATPHRVDVVLDARRGRWHHGAVSLEGGRIRLLSPPSADPVAAVLARLAGVGSAGSAILAPAALHEQVRSKLSLAASLCHTLPPIGAAPLLDPRLSWQPTEVDIEPLYLMGSYAETPSSPPSS